MDTSVADELAINEPYTSRAEVYLGKDEPPHYICIAMKYSDAVTRKSFEQISCMKWRGIRNGIVASEIYHCTVEERQRLKEHLKLFLKDFQIEVPQLSQNVGSMLSS
jgi:hypothetical protein